MSYLYTTTDAAQKLDMPVSTLLSMEQRCAVGPFQRDSSGRRLLTDEDIEQVRRYLEGRKRANGTATTDEG